MPWWLEVALPLVTGAIGAAVGFKLKGKAPPDGKRLR